MLRASDLFTEGGGPTPPPVQAPAPKPRTDQSPAPAKSPAPEPKPDEPDFQCTTPPKPYTYVAWDTETYLIEPGNLTPQLVSIQVQGGDKGTRREPIVFGADDVSKRLGADFIRSIIEDSDIPLVTHNGFYDYAVLLNYYGWPRSLMEAIVRALDAGRIRDTLIRAKLHAIAMGWLDYDPEIGAPAKFDLAELAFKYTAQNIEGKHGPDVWRLRYAELDGIPAHDWPEAAYRYASLDPVYTADVFEAIDYDSPDERMQTEKAWWMHLASCQGLYTDQAKVAELSDKILPAVQEGIRKLVEIGVYRPEKHTVSRNLVKEKLGLADTAAKTLQSSGLAPLTNTEWWVENHPECIQTTPSSKDMARLAAIVTDHFNGDPPRTDTGRVSTARKVLKMIPVLEPLVDIGEFQKVKSTYLPVFANRVVNPRGNPLVSSGRVSYSGPNIANQPRLKGVRECWKAPETIIELKD